MGEKVKIMIFSGINFQNNGGLSKKKRREVFGMGTDKYEFHVFEKYRWSESIHYLKFISGPVQEV